MSEQVNRKCPHRNTISQLSTPYTNTEHSKTMPCNDHMEAMHQSKQATTADFR